MSEYSRDPDSAAERAARERGEHVYDLFQRGSRLLEAGDFAAAAIPLERAGNYPEIGVGQLGPRQFALGQRQPDPRLLDVLPGSGRRDRATP